MNIYMSLSRSIELRKNTSGSYKVRLTIDRGNKYCGARKSLGLGTHQEECALRRAYLIRCLLFHMGWFPGGKIAVKRQPGKDGKRIFWSGVEHSQYDEILKIGRRGGHLKEGGTMMIWYQVNGDFRLEDERPGRRFEGADAWIAALCDGTASESLPDFEYSDCSGSRCSRAGGALTGLLRNKGCRTK